MMKSFLLILSVILLNLNQLNSFITYPFISHDWLDRFLDSIQPVDDVESIIVEKVVPTHEITREIESDLMRYAVDGEECVRKCAKNDKRVCHYNFTIRYYQILGG